MTSIKGRNRLNVRIGLAKQYLDLYNHLKDDYSQITVQDVVTMFAITTKQFAILVDKKLIDKVRVKGTKRYKYKWIGDRPSIHTVDAVLSELTTRKDVSIEPEPIIDKRVTVKELAFRDEACSKALGEFYMKYRKSTTGDLQTFIIAFNTGWDANHNTLIS